MTTEERIQKDAEERFPRFKSHRNSYIVGAQTEAARNKENAIAFEKEIERLKGLIENLYKKTITPPFIGLKTTHEEVRAILENHWQQFKTETNL